MQPPPPPPRFCDTLGEAFAMQNERVNRWPNRPWPKWHNRLRGRDKCCLWCYMSLLQPSFRDCVSHCMSSLWCWRWTQTSISHNNKLSCCNLFKQGPKISTLMKPFIFVFPREGWISVLQDNDSWLETMTTAAELHKDKRPSLREILSYGVIAWFLTPFEPAWCNMWYSDWKGCTPYSQTHTSFLIPNCYFHHR